MAKLLTVKDRVKYQTAPRVTCPRCQAKLLYYGKPAVVKCPLCGCWIYVQGERVAVAVRAGEAILALIRAAGLFRR